MEFAYPIALGLCVFFLFLYLRKQPSISQRNAGYQDQIDGLAIRIKEMDEKDG